jgi:SAM-dependent methyltransferase
VLTYYSATVHADFWTEHWGGHGVAELLAVARASPLTRLISDALPPQGVVLEAGCGLGQYVILLRERGWRAAGVDASVEALVTCRQTAAVPLAASDLRALAIRDGAVAAYVSLGVVEHDPEGPDAILAEARRVLAPGGALIVSVPYVNGVRRLGSAWIRRRQAAIRGRGGAFYQYAFSRPELLAALRRQQFEPLAARPYDPARVLRGALRRARSRVGRTPPPAALVPPSAPPEPAVAPPAPRRWLARVARGALYTGPALRLLGHMLLVVARRA